MEPTTSAGIAGLAESSSEDISRVGETLSQLGVSDTAMRVSQQMSDQVDLLASALDSLWMTVGVLAIAGLLYCFVGYRALKFVMGFTGFLAAGIVAAILAALLSGGQTLAVLAAGAIGGACGCMAVYFLYRAGVFLLGSVGAGILAMRALDGQTESWVPWAVLGCILAGGFLALLLERPAMVFVLSSVGALLVVEAAAMALGAGSQTAVDVWSAGLPDRAGEWIRFAGWLVLTMVGITAQLSAPRRRDEPGPE